MKKQEINWREVRQLLDRFYDGSTTQAEEHFLMDVLTGEDIPEQFCIDAEVFRSLSEEVDSQQIEPELPTGFEQRLMDRIKQEEAADTPVIALSTSHSIKHRWWAVAAACLLVAVLSLPNLFRPNEAETLFAASDISQQEAEEYADYALSLISVNLKSGVQELNELAAVQEQIRSVLSELPD